MASSLAPRTIQTYASAWKSYSTFCITNGLTVLPVTEIKLMDFFTHAALRSISHKSLTVYLSGLSYHSEIRGLPLVLADMHSLYRLMRGIRRTQGNSLTRVKRCPVTINQMFILKSYLRFCFPDRDGTMLWCAFTSAFFGLLRSAEYTSPTMHTFLDSTLMLQDVSWSIDSTKMFISVRASKTDPFRTGTVIRFYKINSPLCPVQAAISYRSVHPCDNGPFFQFQNGSFLTRNKVAECLKSAFPLSTNINTHSFRIGGASAAASRGIPDSIIQIIGRWSSDCFRQYIRISDPDLSLYHQRMSEACMISRTWNSDTLSSQHQ